MEARTELVGSDSWEYKRKSNWDLKATGGSRNQKTIVKTSEEAGTNPVLVEYVHWKGNLKRQKRKQAERI